MTVDSDTILMPQAIIAMIVTAMVTRATGVSGTVELVNRKQNLLTRMIGCGYWFSYFQERASQSVFGCVTVCSGAISLYRRPFVQGVLDEYRSQTFFGRQVRAGDDRVLTTLALLAGKKTVWCSQAVALTETPATLPMYLKQQLRWTRSVIATAPFMVARIKDWSAPFWFWQNKQLFRYVYHFNTMSLVLAACVKQMTPMPLVYLMLAVLMIASIKAAIALLWTRDLNFLLLPLWGLFNLFAYFGIMAWALATPTDTGWVTRKT